MQQVNPGLYVSVYMYHIKWVELPVFLSMSNINDPCTSVIYLVIPVYRKHLKTHLFNSSYTTWHHPPVHTHNLGLLTLDECPSTVTFLPRFLIIDQ